MSENDTVLQGVPFELELRKRVPNPNGVGVTTVADGKARVSYTVVVDAFRLQQMAERAVRNKKHRARSGPLSVVIQSITRS